MTLTRRARWILGIIASAVLVFIYFPLGVVIVNSFNASKVFAWPPTGWTTEWWHKAATGATIIALLLGSMIAFAVARYDFFGKQPVSFLVILPIALPGIVTGIALNSSFNTVLVPLGISFGLFTVILGHATFCIVVVFNNVVARLRRTGTGLEEAAMDLGAGPFQTFRDVTFPAVRSALVAGSIFTFSLTLGDYIMVKIVGGSSQMWANIIYDNVGVANNLPLAAAAAIFPITVVICYLLAVRRTGALENL